MPRVQTWDVLRSVGFIENPNAFSDPPGALSFNFGNFKLGVIVCINRWLQPVLRLSGVMSTPRTITSLEDDLPREVDSSEEALAFVAWSLDNAAGETFQPTTPVPWLEEGRSYRHLLPWEKKKIAYESRPRCVVEREWMKVALKGLRSAVDSATNDTSIIFHFDGEVLKIRCPVGLLAMPASGKAWPSQFSIAATSLRPLPKRITQGKIEISIWNSNLSLGNRLFPGVTALESFQ